MILLSIVSFGIFYINDKYIFQNEPINLSTLDYTVSSYIIRNTFVFALYAILIRLTIDWVNNEKEKNELIQQNKISELALLRNQINPHFLFNSLNNIYSLVYNKADNAAKSVLELSSLMRYMLYESNCDKVELKKEIDYLNSYIALQILRIGNPDFVKFTIEGSAKNRYIAPMLLIPFIENAFKHSAKKNKSSGIVISLDITTDCIKFEVINDVYSKKTNKDDVGGIGLGNVKRRLQLLYPSNSSLKIEEKEDKYFVTLIINEQ